MPLTFEQKQAVLRQLDTKTLVAQAQDKLQGLYTHQKAEIDFVRENRDYLAGRGELCRAAKAREAELRAEAPNSKAAEVEAWLLRQRKEDDQLKRILQRQAEIEFQLDTKKAEGEHLRRQVAATDSLIHLRIAQINFLASNA